MRSPFRALLALTVGLTPLVATQLIGAPTASAQDTTPPAALIVLDASGSMAASGAGGVRLIDQARSAVSSTVAALPASARVGLRVYGSQVGSEESQKAAGCQDSTLLVPVGPLNVPAINAAVQSVQPKGWTPTGLALIQGAKDLPTTGPRTIVLVSDGLETCAPPDPCEVAKQLAAEGTPVKVEAIGFNLPAGDPARGQLQCIAGATGGEYHDAADASQLASALQTSSQRALRGFNASGQLTAGTTDPVRAPFLPTDGSASKDTIVPGQTKYYAIGVAPGDRPETQVTLGNDQPGLVPAKACNASFRTQLLTSTMTSADSESKTFDGKASLTLRNTMQSSYEVVPQLDTAKPSSAYPAGGWYLQVDLTPGTCSTGEPPLPPRDYQLEVTNSGATLKPLPVATTTVAGTALTNAPSLTSGSPVRDTIRVGETAWFSVDVPKGSRLGARLIVGGDPNAVSDACTASAKLELLNRSSDYAGSDTTSFDGRKSAGANASTSSTEAVGEASSEYSNIAEAGKYYVTVNLKQGSSCTGKMPISDLEYPVSLVADVVPFSVAATATPSPSATPTDTADSAVAPSTGGGTSPWIWVAIGVLLIGAAVVALVVVLRKRTQPTLRY